MKTTKYFLIAFVLLFNVKAYSWGDKGHKMVAAIARELMTKSAINSVQKYLGNDMSFEKAAVWMDDLKDDEKYNFMKPWHFVNATYGKKYKPSNDSNAINTINKVIASLKNRKGRTDEQIKQDIMILFHLVGDIHQPLHCGYAEDKGGNSVEAPFNGNKKSSLHTLWDTGIIEYKKMTYQECLKLKESGKIDLATLDKKSVLAWFDEARLLLDTVYVSKNHKITSITITAKYVETATRIIKERILISGSRLATILNDVFPD